MRLPPRRKDGRFRGRRNPKAKTEKIKLGGYQTSPKLFKPPKKRHKKAKAQQMGLFESLFSGHQPSLFNR